jgi:peroxiredoxin Q/BCP
MPQVNISDWNIGDKAPDFNLPTNQSVQGGGNVSLSGLKGQYVVVYFYPKDDTSGCTKEACAFNDALADFSGSAATVIGISRDSVASHDKFAKKYGLNITLASDEDGQVCEAYGTWVEKSMYGRKYMGIARATFLIDPQGKFAAIWPKVAVPGHSDEVLAAIKAHKAKAA